MSLPEEFFDMRQCKRNANSPDFKHKFCRDAVWLNTASRRLLEQVKEWDSVDSPDALKVQFCVKAMPMLLRKGGAKNVSRPRSHLRIKLQHFAPLVCSPVKVPT